MRKNQAKHCGGGCINFKLLSDIQIILNQWFSDSIFNPDNFPSIIISRLYIVKTSRPPQAEKQKQTGERN